MKIKTLITCSWTHTVKIEFDESRLNDESYLDEIRSKVVEECSKVVEECPKVINFRCEDFPRLAQGLVRKPRFV